MPAAKTPAKKAPAKKAQDLQSDAVGILMADQEFGHHVRPEGVVLWDNPDTLVEAARQVVDDRDVHHRLSAVFAKVPAIAKDANNVASNYAARSIDDVMAVMHKLLADEGLHLIPNHHPPTITRTLNDKGKVVTDSVVLIDYTFYAPDGSNVTMTVSSEGRDWADKATNKAASNALKYGLLHAFLIPVNEFDADTETIEVTRAPRPAPASTQGQPATPQEHPDLRARTAVLDYCNGSKTAAKTAWVSIVTGLGLEAEVIVENESDAQRIIDEVAKLRQAEPSQGEFESSDYA